MTTDAAQDPGELIEAYYEAGWTDGLPVVPPSDASVEAMLAAGGFRGNEVIGEIAGRNTEVVADKVAINAVMAGCRPEYLPVVVAALRGLCHRDFSYHGPASSTGGSAMVLIVNGPIVRRLAINHGNNAFGQGHRPNATIGRAVRLVMMNAMNTRPGFLDRATLGNPGKYTFCFAETEDDHPWEPLSVSRGCAPSDSAVTVIATNSLYQVYNQLAATPEPLLLCFADALANLGSPNLKGFNESLIVLAGEHAEVLRRMRELPGQTTRAIVGGAIGKQDAAGNWRKTSTQRTRYRLATLPPVSRRGARPLIPGDRNRPIRLSETARTRRRVFPYDLTRPAF
jgi:hypothetical protein